MLVQNVSDSSDLSWVTSIGRVTLMADGNLVGFTLMRWEEWTDTSTSFKCRPIRIISSLFSYRPFSEMMEHVRWRLWFMPSSIYLYLSCNKAVAAQWTKLDLVAINEKHYLTEFELNSPSTLYYHPWLLRSPPAFFPCYPQSHQSRSEELYPRSSARLQRDHQG